MPELPDIQVFSSNLKLLFAGKKLNKITVVNGKKLQDTQKELSASLEGKILKDIYRSGKEIRLLFSGNTLLGMHLMLTGDILPFDITNESKFSIVELYFSNSKGFALTDRMRNANVRLNPEDKNGIDALDKGLNYKYLKSIFNRKAKVKNILLDQNFIRGIGNSYSDEILWLTKVSPFSVCEAIPDEKIKELALNIKKVLRKEIANIMKKYPGLIHGEVKDFMKIHTRHKTHSPTGFPIKMEKRGMMKTYYTDEQELYV
ncbi:MAG: Fpg/Nei family DNA glycosylase [Bacteroidota bacterium]|nr:Fpg/Nei family DNA glycosylase [Bacteroidota bacterium]